MNGGPARLALVACLVVLAGCTFGIGGEALAPDAGGNNATVANATDDSEMGQTDGLRRVSLENSSLELPADRILADLETLIETDVDMPPIQVIEPTPSTDGEPDRENGSATESERDGTGESGDDEPRPDADAATPYFAQTPYRFAQHLALDEVGLNRSASRVDGGVASGTTNQFGSVTLHVANATRAQQETLLVHEFTHVIQVRTEMLPWALSELLQNVPTDEAQAKWALTEGAAVWVTDRYATEHMPENTTLQSTEMARVYEDARVGTRFAVARYHLGARGVDRHLDSPAQLRELYAAPVPNTTEQVIHGYRPTEEPMRRVALDASGGDGWEPTDTDDEDRLGELVTRVVLSKELSLDASAEAAAGWGYDELVQYERDETAGFAWVTRWDDPANASEAQSAFETYVERRDTDGDLAFGVERAGEEVVVLYSGPPAFVEAAAADVDGDTVQIGVENAS